MIPDRRWLRLARLGARRASGLAATRVRGAAATESRRRELDEQFAIRSAEDVAAELGSMKGAAMKLGQMLSFQIEGLPPAAQKSLASLQANVEPMSPSLAEHTFATSIGMHPTRAFLDWDPIPVAAASIGQVHRAVLRSGADVAVKIQYPGVADAIRSDLDSARMLHRLVSLVALRNLDVDAVVDELRSRLTEEVDYVLEAERQRRFARRYSGHPFINVPGVHDRWSSDVVLTTDWAPGLDWAEFEAVADEAARQRAAESIFRFVQGALYCVTEFNGDPHPGNWKLDTDGSVTVLDFGLVKKWTDADTNVLWPIIDPLLASDRETTLARAVDAGFLPADHGLDTDHVWAYVSAPYIPFMADEFQFSRDFTRTTLRAMVDVRGPHNDVLNTLSMPGSFVLLDRVVWGLTALLGRLDATNHWRDILSEYRKGTDPVTELGRLEADWVTARGGWDALAAL